MMNTKLILKISGFAAVSLLSACTSLVPVEIKQPVEGSPSVTQVHHQLDAHKAKKVRWGGIILENASKQDASWLKIIALPLYEGGEPVSTDQSPGRFIAIVNQFLEPEVYKSDRQITVTGHVLRYETQKVGEFSYNYPVIQVDHYYLWPVKTEPQYNDYPPYWWHDPFYPWPYPYHPPRR